ncbi:hypothetical protein EDB80DRAFT_591835 [Ilyonectria destructans]|nr:hypothetical protein EDB80DRAFT_591835 [Ilyonectria destructans]
MGTECCSSSRGDLPTKTPNVIDDAIKATKGVGFTYLWIDRYCIPQEDKSSKNIQI